MLALRSENLAVEAWEAWYRIGGETVKFRSDRCLWGDLPRDGMLLVIWWHHYHVPGVRMKTLTAGDDYYLFSDVWFGSTNDYGQVIGQDFKRGTWVPDQIMEEVYRSAFEKLDL